MYTVHERTPVLTIPCSAHHVYYYQRFSRHFVAAVVSWLQQGRDRIKIVQRKDNRLLSDQIKIPFQCLNSATEPFSFLWTEKPSSLCTNFFDLGVKVVSCFIRCFAVYCLYCWYLWLRARTVTSCPRLRLVVQHKENKKVGWSVFVWQVWSEELAISGQPVGLLCSG